MKFKKKITMGIRGALKRGVLIIGKRFTTINVKDKINLNNVKKISASVVKRTQQKLEHLTISHEETCVYRMSLLSLFST